MTLQKFVDSLEPALDESPSGPDARETIDEERLHRTVEGAREYAIFLLDRAGRVANWNDEARRSKGWEADEIIGKSFDVFFTPEDRKAGTPGRTLDKATREGNVETHGFRVRRDGTRFFASSRLTALHSPSGELLGFVKITRDLTPKLEADELERRLNIERAERQAAQAAEQRVRESEERLRRLQRVTAALSEAATPLEVVGVVLDQIVEAFHANGDAVYALSSDGLHLDLLAQRGHPDDELEPYTRLPLEASTPVTDAARTGKPAFFESFEACASQYPHLRSAISVGGFEGSVALPLMLHGNLLGVLGIRFRDSRNFDERERALLVTLSELCSQALDRARLLASERAARAEAESASRAKDEFLAMLGHELRNPLAPIVTALSIMKQRSDGIWQKERAVIERQVSHLVRLVDDLLDVSRITRGLVELKKEPLEIATIVARSIEQSSPLLEQRRHHLSITIPEQGLVVDGDATRLAQVLSNLLTNAAKYTPPGGEIELIAERNDDSVMLTVKDNGVGIEPSMLSQVFELFSQEPQSVARSQGGLGLGLAIAKSLLELHGGTIVAKSEGRGTGSTFTVILPLAVARPRETSRTHDGALAPALRQQRLLVVDDNLDAAEMLEDWLSNLGYDVRTAHDGLAALEAVRTFNPEIVLLDIGLPVLDGLEVVRRVRAEPGVAPLFVAITGYGQAADRALSAREGFVEHLVKPISLARLGELLERLQKPASEQQPPNP